MIHRVSFRTGKHFTRGLNSLPTCETRCHNVEAQCFAPTLRMVVTTRKRNVEPKILTQRRSENIDATSNRKYRRKALRLYIVRGNNMRTHGTIGTHVSHVSHLSHKI